MSNVIATIETTAVAASITAAGLAVTISPATAPAAVVIGQPGPQGPAGPQGPKGDPGPGLAAGGTAGQVPVKLSATDHDVGWASGFHVDPATGNVGIGLSPVDRARLAIQGFDGSRYDGAIMRVFPRSGPETLRIQNDGSVLFMNARFDIHSSATFSFVGINVSESGATTYLNAYSSSDKYLYFYNSYAGTPDPACHLVLGDGSLQVRGQADSYFDNRLGIGTRAPTAPLHVDGAVRVGSYTVATLPSAASLGAGAIVFVSDEAGGPTLAFSDGTSWRRVQDGALVS